MIDVLINGAGPAGASLGIDLARRGLDIRIIDKAPHAFDGSRAKGLQPRTLEVLHDLDVLDLIIAGGSVYPPLGIHLGPVTIPWRMMGKGEPDVAVPYPDTWLIPQHRTDRALHARLDGLGHRVEFGTELREFRQGEEAVTAKVAAAPGIEEITARYLVGADGGSSTVRKRLGIEFAGSTDEQDRMLLVDAVVTGLSRDRWHIWPRPGGRFVGACPLPHSDLFQVMIRLAPDERPPSDEEQINRRIQADVHDRRITLHGIRWTSVFRPNIRLAESYRLGRVLLAGDAAHVHTPAGAQGLNTGIQDGYNLGWKLAQVLAGADDRLLDSYQDERLPVAAGVLGLSTRKYDAIAKLRPSSIRRGRDEQQLALTYRGGPLAPTGGDHTTTLEVGDRAPNADLIDVDGRPIRLFDAYRGPHFTAIAFGPGASRDLDRLDWPSTGAGLRRIAVDAGAHGPTSRADHVLVDAAQAFRRVYGPTTDTLLLIRPDGYIGHIATRNMLTSTNAATRAMTPTARSPDAR
ncbi:MAG TPA: FAD-dependent oxidoreductase [Pseudonocardia sp.]|jgi:2-polyprenyl-6-methoxyphenol hydroxylase-like FAD-dependent oxidoreductase